MGIPPCSLLISPPEGEERFTAAQDHQTTQGLDMANLYPSTVSQGVRKWEKKDKEQIGISLYRRVGHHPQNFDQVRGHQDDRGAAVDF